MRKHSGLIIAGMILLIGGIVLFTQQEPNKTASSDKKNAIVKNEKGVVVANNEIMTQGDQATYSGTVLAGTTTPYIVFNQADYDQAVQRGKVIFLEFYATWCPICRAQEPKLFEGFETLNNPNVVGFRVNYNDPETDDVEKQLAKDFGVSYQHTHVLLKEGKVVAKSSEDLDKASFLAFIENAK